MSARVERPDQNIGRVVHRYQIRKKIGQGGVCRVYLAEHTGLGKAVALKLFKPELSLSPEVRSRFLREAQVSAGLSHPNVVEIFDVGEDKDGQCFMVMEYLRGVSLAQELSSRGRLPEEEIRR